MGDPSELLAREAERMADHVRRLLLPGDDGHHYDTSHIGGRVDTTTLLLKTFGRRSGKVIYVPLIYVKYGEEYALAASKGGADEHPAWYLNLTAQPDITFKVAGKIHRGSWREISGEERAAVWKALSDHYDPYHAYEKATDRLIPVLMLKPIEELVEI